MVKTYCPQCRKEIEGQIIQRKEIYKVKGEDISIDSSILHCIECNTEIFDSVIDGNNITSAYNDYKAKHKLLTSDQVKALREKYGLSQRSLGTLLGWGEVTIHRYENGAIQDESHNEVLMLIEKPEIMIEIFNKNSDLLPDRIKVDLDKRIKELLSEETKPNFYNALENILNSSNQRNEFNGYNRFDLEKIYNLIIYIISYYDGIFKTKLNKILWYVDFLYFKYNSLSISGNSYTHSQYGPTFDGYELIIGSMYNDQIIDKEEVIRHENCLVELWKANNICDKRFFNASEIEVINYVLEVFKDYTSEKISEYSHKEKPYLDTKDGEKISYNLAKDISISLNK
ncbi:MAG: type II TA system antitoxin MqsA family protein [Elusimicrobiota bacterium]